jgi:hypothetical protein
VYHIHVHIRIFKVGFLSSEYNEYHYSTRHDLFISDFDPRIRFEKKNYLYLYPQYPFISDPFSSLLKTMRDLHFDGLSAAPTFP